MDYKISMQKLFVWGPVAKTLPLSADGTGLIPGRGTEVPNVEMCPENIKN